MRVVDTITFFDRVAPSGRPVLDDHLADVSAAVRAVHWPPGTGDFTINPTRMGNGVVPIKAAFARVLRELGWATEVALWRRLEGPGKFDAAKGSGKVSVVEWETGNISSSHRAIAKMSLALQEGRAWQGILVLPTKQLYQYLTDRIGNWSELAPYRSLYSRTDIPGRLLAVLVEHDAVDATVPLIGKGTDGRALR